MANTNCLADRRCPGCGQEQAFDVVATSVFRLLDDGTDYHTDVEYDDDAPTYCPLCDWSGTWGNLRVDGEAASAG